MTTEQHKQAFRRCLDVVNGADPSLVEGLFAEDAHLRSPGEPNGLRGVSGFQHFVLKLRAGFPDLHTTIEELVAEGDNVVGRVALRGTHRGEYRGIPPTGRTIAQTEMIMVRFVDGRIQDVWQVLDALGIMQQLGMVPRGNPPRLLARLIVGLQRLRWRAGERMH